MAFRSRGFCFLEFTDHHSASKCMFWMNHPKFRLSQRQRKPGKVTWANPRKEVNPEAMAQV